MQQKTAPYDAVFVSAANWAFHLEDGIVKMGASALAFKKLLDQHVYCTQNNDFDGAQIFIQPGFKGRRIMVPDTPAFEKNKMFNFYNNQEQWVKQRINPPNKGTWEWNNTMLLHQQKQNRSPQHLPHHNRPFLLPHQPFQYNWKDWKAVLSPLKGIYSSWWHRTAICPWSQFRYAGNVE